MAEDNEINREIAQNILEMNGFSVTCAVDGREALECFCGSEPGEFDAILMDIRMPLMDGLTAANSIRHLSNEDAQTIPIIAMTANAFNDDRITTKKAGMNENIAKPLNMKMRIETIEKLTDKVKAI